jgi:NAD(P)-dependent dehydrogenase (short-subunit alcohol dehydrogenase family)
MVGVAGLPAKNRSDAEPLCESPGMNIDGRTVLVTGAARGIGRSLALACAGAGARVAITDVLVEELAAVRAELNDEGHLAVPCDLTEGDAITAMVATVREQLGPVEVCFANAGVAVGTDPLQTSEETWELALDVNLRQHVRLARLLLPDWLERGEGYFVATASAAGLLTQIGSAPYAVSKHAAVAFAEWLSVTYGGRGLRVSCVCPMGVDTAMLTAAETGALESLGARVVRAAGDVLQPDQVASTVLEAMAQERFLILPHPEVGTFFERKGSDYERWLAGMRRLQSAVG